MRLQQQLSHCLPGVTSISKGRRSRQPAGSWLLSCRARRADECLPPWESTRVEQQHDLQPRLLQACVWAAEQHQLDLAPPQVERHLAQLCALLPELRPWLLYIADHEPSLLAALLLEPAALQAKLLELKRLLPAADVGKLAARHPYVLFTDSWTVEVVLQRVREGRKVEDLNKALEADPEFLSVIIEYLEWADRGLL